MYHSFGMMNRSTDIMFMAEYIKNVLYFATVRHGKTLKSTSDTHYFCIDNELVYENYYSDFGPLNLGCIYKYCRILNEKINQYLNHQIIVHYTSIDPKKKANAAFLLGCYGVLYLSLSPRDALKPLQIHGQNYRPFQDATQGDSSFTISLLDCLQAIKKARELGFFNFQDFNYEEYERLDKIQGGDLNWIVPGKFLAFIGPVDYSISLYHPPEMYLDYFLENNVKIVIRLNKRLYDANVFNNVGIVHYDLFFIDGSCPSRTILFKFLQISEDADCAIAVHCKAGLGRTGSLIGCYLIKHYKMTSHEAIGWMRICRPGSVIGHQQGWLEQLEPWLIKQGNIYRRHSCHDPDKLPYHEYGIYSIAEQSKKQRPLVIKKSPSPPPPLQNPNKRPSDTLAPVRPQNSRIKEDKSVVEEEENQEKYVASCDLTKQSAGSTQQLKGCVIKHINEDVTESDLFEEREKISNWKKYLCCRPCLKTINDSLFTLAVRCASVTPKKCYSNTLCSLLDLVCKQIYYSDASVFINVVVSTHFNYLLHIAINKAAEKERDWRMKWKSFSNNQKIPLGGRSREQFDTQDAKSQRSSGAGEPKAGRPAPQSSTQYESTKSNASQVSRNVSPITTFRTSQAPLIKSVNDAKNYLMRSSIYNRDRDKILNSSITVTSPGRFSNNMATSPCSVSVAPIARPTAAPKTSPLQTYRRRLGRSPSPPIRSTQEQTRATNTPSTTEKVVPKNMSRSSIKVLSRLKSGNCEGSLGAASLGANRDAPVPRMTSSVRSDERPLATQGDMLNSIKFERRFREAMLSERPVFEKNWKPGVNNISSRTSNVNTKTNNVNKPHTTSPNPVGSNRDDRSRTRSFFSPSRPMSPKGRRNTQTSSY